MQELFHSDVAKVLDVDLLVGFSFNYRNEHKELRYNPWKSVWLVFHKGVVIDSDKRLDIMLHLYNSI